MPEFKACDFSTRTLCVLLASACVMLFQTAGSAAKTSAEGFNIALSAEMQDAVNNGVPLYFKCEFAVRHSYWLFSISRKVKNHQFLLKRHALSNRYIVKRDGLDTPHIFRSTVEASNYIAAQAVMLMESYHDAENPYSMRLYLNIFELPGPLRLYAFVFDAWDLDTGWIAWTFAS